ncbi:MAG TPA: transposase [Solirubrobacteraceae bacterium]|nr:transposase [Solirubrobacteraceae bacterium]
MAIAIRTGEQTRQVQMVCLDELVPDDDVLRRVERLVSWEQVRATAEPFYCDFGRPGVDPVVLIKVFLVAAVRGLGSMRETLRIANVDLSVRRFLGYGLTEALPHHATFSYAQCVRFANSTVFEQLFTQVLASCRDAGLLDGSRLIVDATHVEANAALKSLRAELDVIDGGGEKDAGNEPISERPALALAEPRTGPTPKRTASNATAVSTSDPDAKLRYKPGHRPHLVHRAQVATDPKARVIVAVYAERATGHEADSLPVIIDRARWLRHKVDELVADAGYASKSVYESLQDAGITAFIPPQPNMRKSQHGQAARSRCKSPAGVGAAVDRITHSEGAIAEMKRHGAGRARSCGTGKLQIQLLLAATAINLKRLIKTADAAKNPAAGNDQAHQAETQTQTQLAILQACLRELGPIPSTTSTTGS